MSTGRSVTADEAIAPVPAKVCKHCGFPALKFRYGGVCDACGNFRTRRGRLPEPHEMRSRNQHFTLCTNCNHGIAVIGGLCRACDRWQRRHGVKRPAAQWNRRKICRNCRDKKAECKGMCDACYHYKRSHGRNRPRYYWAECCLNCKRSGVDLVKGRCAACRKYFYRTGNERPEHCWKRYAPHGWCDCGRPAVTTVTLNVDHGATKYNLCKECYEVEQGALR